MCLKTANTINTFVEEVQNFLTEHINYVSGQNKNELPCFQVGIKASSPLFVLLFPIISRPELIPSEPFFRQLQTEKIHEGINYFCIWEDVWKVKKQNVQSILLSRFGETKRIYARDTFVRPIDKSAIRNFLNDNHLHVALAEKYNYGLFRFTELLAVVCFSRPRKIMRNGQLYQSCELVRYSSKLNHTISGGVSKLLKYFIDDHQPDDIMTYADLDTSLGTSYERLGFKKIDVLPPQLFYLNLENFERLYPKFQKESDFPDQKVVKVFNIGSIKYLLDLKK